MAEAALTGASRDPLPVTVRKATRADWNALVAVMARAFDDDPVVNWVVKQDRRRARRVYDFMEVGLRMSFPHGEVYTTTDLEGGAFWTPPGHWKPSFFQQLRVLPGLLRAITPRRLPLVLRGLNEVERRHPHAPHFYLLALGVEPELAGRGIGTQLMRPVLERCDADGIPAYLESSKERNIPLYERNGFRVTEVSHLPGGGPPLWHMWRDPR